MCLKMVVLEVGQYNLSCMALLDRLPAPILFTTNCLMPPKVSYADCVYITSVVSYPEIRVCLTLASATTPTVPFRLHWRWRTRLAAA